jgi:hypothetical protein
VELEFRAQTRSRERILHLSIRDDDGIGGADPTRGTGLIGEGADQRHQPLHALEYRTALLCNGKPSTAPPNLQLGGIGNTSQLRARRGAGREELSARGAKLARGASVAPVNRVPPGNENRKCPHGVILKVVASNICGSDQHMVRGRTTAPVGLILGHEITGEVVEKGPDVENLAVGDLVSVPFNVSCGRCRNCRESNTGVCIDVNPERPGGAHGYVDMGGWPGGQAEYVMVPYADWTALRFPDRDQALDKIRDLTMITDIFPTGYQAASPRGRALDRRSTSPAQARSVWPPRRRRSCSVPRW